MSNLVKLLYDMAALKADYQRLHDEIFGLSARRLLFLLRPKARRGVEDRINLLISRLDALGEDMRGLTAEDLAIRRGQELRQALEVFAQALGETLRQLEALRLARTPSATAAAPTTGRSPLATYDDALQHQRQLGARLNELIVDL
ncbi:MAG: hypothetical protein EOM92_06890 [Gammaproteobacteria bacterium]|jgi:hypothetical protein|nr:hypothetical protein [Gammaproteobacteria bacterium]